MIPAVVIWSIGFCVALWLTSKIIPYCISVAYRFSILDCPDGSVKRHKAPTPYLGGVGVYLGFLVTLGLVFPFDNQFFLFFIGLTLLFFVGLTDDLMPLSPAQKAIGQLLAVICFLKGGIYVKAHVLHNIPTIIISAFWMVLVINAFNLLDIMDGLMTTIAAACTVMFLGIAIVGNQTTIALLLAIFLGTLLAFLRFNAPPRALIYLGDAGSLFVGGVLAVVPFFINWGEFSYYGFLAPFIVLALPLLEVTYLIVIRMGKGIPFYKPSSDHFALYLRRQGYTPAMIILFVIVASFILATHVWLFVLGYLSCATIVAQGFLFVTIWTYVIYLR